MAQANQILLHMRSQAGGLRQVANNAVIDRSRMPLQFYEFDRIIRLAAGGNGVRAVMAGFAVHATMAG